jgi:hypothetical protein
MGNSDLTDGTWVWPQGLVHYVDEHGLGLPEEFVDQVLANKAVVPPLREEIRTMTHAQKVTTVDRGFWNQWYVDLVGVSNREDPLQVSGDIVNTRPTGTKPR